MSTDDRSLKDKIIKRRLEPLTEEAFAQDQPITEVRPRGGGNLTRDPCLHLGEADVRPPGR
jgi:hypothetical protein